MEGKITVIIPVYNVEKYLDSCLKSVVNQTVPFDEVIVVNDGSTDKSQSICEHYAFHYPYIKLIHQENMGLSKARNTGMQLAFCAYLMFLDSDDFLSENTVSRLKQELKKSCADGVIFRSQVFCEDGIQEISHGGNHSIDFYGMPVSGWDYFIRSYPENYVVSSCFTVYRKEFLESKGISFPEGLYYEDNYFLFSFITQAKSVVQLSEKLYHRRRRKDSITTSSYSERKFKDYIKVVLKIWKEIVQKERLYNVPQKKALLKFVNDHFHEILNHHQLCQQENIQLERQAQLLFSYIASQYQMVLDWFEVWDWSAEWVDLGDWNQMLDNLHGIRLWCGERRCGIFKTIQKTINREKHLYRQVLESLPFHQKKTVVGIYGTGNHTQGLLAIYEKAVGKIECDLVFLDSFKDQETYREKPVIHYKKIKNLLGEVILSSFVYEPQMEKNVERVDSTIKIHKFYSHLKRDVFSEYKLFVEYFDWMKGGTIVIFGAGNFGTYAGQYCKKIFPKAEIVFCDNDKNRQSQTLDGCKILSPEEAAKKYPDAMYLIANDFHAQEMEKQLSLNGIGKHQISIFSRQDYCFMLSLDEMWEINQNLYEEITGNPVNKNSLRTFTEKMQYSKIYLSNGEKEKLTDKYQVRQWVEETIGERYLVPLLNVYDTPDEIDFEALPDAFVLKASHGCEMNLIVPDKRQLDRKQAVEQMWRWMNFNFAAHSFEMHYKNIRPCIVAEEYIKNFEKESFDYKFFCFDGKVRMIMVVKNIHQQGAARCFYDETFHFIPCILKDGVPMAEVPFEKPECLEEMIGIAETLSQGMDQVRVDLYGPEGRIYFGEMTFTSWSGRAKIEPRQVDEWLGGYWNMGEIK